MYKNVSIIKRILKVYEILSNNFHLRLIPILIGIYLIFIRLLVFVFSTLDLFFISKLRRIKIKQPILIVGNPRSGTTFLHHYLTSHNFGTGSQLWQMLYPSVLFQKLLKPILPFLEKYSPTKYHSTDAHKTSLQSVETDDASILFRYLDGFFYMDFYYLGTKITYLIG